MDHSCHDFRSIFLFSRLSHRCPHVPWSCGHYFFPFLFLTLFGHLILSHQKQRQSHMSFGEAFYLFGQATGHPSDKPRPILVSYLGIHHKVTVLSRPHRGHPPTVPPPHKDLVHGLLSSIQQRPRHLGLKGLDPVGGTRHRSRSRLVWARRPIQSG